MAQVKSNDVLHVDPSFTVRDMIDGSPSVYVDGKLVKHLLVTDEKYIYWWGGVFLEMVLTSNPFAFSDSFLAIDGERKARTLVTIRFPEGIHMKDYVTYGDLIDASRDRLHEESGFPHLQKINVDHTHSLLQQFIPYCEKLRDNPRDVNWKNFTQTINSFSDSLLTDTDAYWVNIYFHTLFQKITLKDNVRVHYTLDEKRVSSLAEHFCYLMSEEKTAKNVVHCLTTLCLFAVTAESLGFIVTVRDNIDLM